MPDNVLEIEIDPEIQLKPGQCYELPGNPEGPKQKAEMIERMPDSIKGNLLATMTVAAKKYGCHWTELVWGIAVNAGQPIIKVKKNDTN